MPITGTRKIIQVGGSRSVSLPPGWLEACDLALGDDVRFIADGVIVFVPPGQRLELKQFQPFVDIANRKAAKK